MNKYKIRYKEAIIAHELGHMADWCKMNWFSFHILRDGKRLFRKYKREEEIIADKYAIQLGYAHELYNQRKARFRSKDIQDLKIQKYYWSHNEIKEYAKSINKW